MAISIKEYLGVGNITDDNMADNMDVKESANEFLAPKADTLMVEIEAIHAYPYHTRNNTRYMPEALKQSQKLWCQSYRRPMIMHHDETSKVIGRIYDATYTENSKIPGVGALVLTASIPDKESAEAVENDLLCTTSIGVSASDVRCSICGAKIDSREGCPEGHVRGGVYNGQTAYWDIYSISPKECSFVVVPSDEYSAKIRSYKASEPNSKSNVVRHENVDDNLNGNVKIKEADSNNSDNGENSMELEQELATAKAQVAELQKQLDEANKALEELAAVKTQNEEQSKKLADIQALLDNANKELEEEKAKLVVSEDALEAEKAAKESADKAGLELQEKFKAFAEGVLNQYRKLTEKRELTKEELSARSMDSILVSIVDVAEELKVGAKQPEINLNEAGKVPNPVAPANEKPVKSVPAKEYKVNLSESLEAIFTEAASLRY